MFSHLTRPKLLRTLAGATCLALCGAAGALIAQQSNPLPPAAPVATAAPAEPAKPQAAAPAAQMAISDVALARSVLVALDNDPALKKVNVLVSVVDHGAVIGGPVASEDVKKRIEAVVRSVAGVQSVKNLCFVQADPDPLFRAVADRLKPGAAPSSPALPGVALAPTAPEGSLPPLPPDVPSDLILGAKPDTVAAKPPVLPPVNILGAPVAVGPSTGAKVPPLPGVKPEVPPAPMFPTAPGALTGSNPPAKPADLHAAALAVRKSEPRFARLTVELKPDGALFISGSSATKEDAWDFAAELRKIPGSGRVAIDPALVR